MAEEFKRHFDEKFFNTYKKDLIKLIKLVNQYDRQVDFQIRANDSFNLYHLGDSLGAVSFQKATNNFNISVASAFKPFEKLSKTAKNELGKCEETKKAKNVIYSFKNFNTYFSKTTVDSLCMAIRKRNFQEERQVEQKIIADNMHKSDFFIIDDEVRIPQCIGRLDMLALKKEKGNNYNLVLLELKLINNKEAENGDVIEQINSYERSFSDNINSVANSYEINYKQKRELGIFGDDFPKEIKINRNKIEKAIVISGGITKANKLAKDIKTKYGIKTIITSFDISNEI